MKTAKILLATAVCLCVALPAAGADTAKLLADTAARAKDALAMVRCVFNTGAREQTLTGPAICIDPAGLLMTRAVRAHIRVEDIKTLELIIPGPDAETVEATLVGIDAATGFGFVQAKGARKWAAIRFAKQSNLEIGQEVTSAGLMLSDPGFAPCVGAAYVSSVLRLPHRLVYVTGGKLTGRGSVVFRADGQAIGIVSIGDQPSLSYLTTTPQGRGLMELRGLNETAFFLPVEEFVHVIESIPTGGRVRRPGWAGVYKYEAIEKGDYAENVIKLDRPGVLVDTVIPNTPAAQAGLKTTDVIVALNGEGVEKLATGSLTMGNFVRQIRRLPAGTKVTLSVYADQKTRDVSLTLIPMPTWPNEARQYVDRQRGFAVREKVMLDRYIIKGPTAEAEGLLVIAVGPQTQAARAGLQADDVIVSANGTEVKDVAGFKAVLDAATTATPPAEIKLIIRRGNQGQIITLGP